MNRAEAESGSLWFEAETGDPLTMVELETDRPDVNSLHRCKANDELRDWQDTVAAGQSW